VRHSLLLLATLILSFTACECFAQHDAGNHAGVGIGVKASTLGIGADIAFPMSERANLRAGFNAFKYNRSFDRDGINYGGTLTLRSMEALVDYFPGGGGFHVSPGVLLYNSNNLKATAAVPGGQAFDLGNATYLSNPANPINGSGKLTTNKVAPMLLLGFGNLVPRTRHFSMSFEFGAAFHGTPKATLSLAGSACDFSGLNCRNAATDPNVQSNVQAEVDKLNKSASPWKIYPVVSLGFGYKF